MIYSISYDLKKPDQNYAALHKAIKECGTWWHYLASTWLIDTAADATQIWNHLAPHIDTNDRVLIIRVTRDYQGWMNKEAWDWINGRLVA